MIRLLLVTTFLAACGVKAPPRPPLKPQGEAPAQPAAPQKQDPPAAAPAAATGECPGEPANPKNAP